jgi:hypothetical protein
MNEATTFRRRATGASLIAAPLVILAGGTLTPPQSDDSNAALLAAAAAHPVQAQVSAVLLAFGFALLIPAALGMLSLVRERSIRLGHVGGALAIVGGALLPGIVIVDFYGLALAESLDPATALAVDERAQDYALSLLIYLPANLGVVLGHTLLALAVTRAGHAPRWVPAGVVGGWVLCFVASANIALFAAGAALMALALGQVGLTLLRGSRGAAHASTQVSYG